MCLAWRCVSIDHWATVPVGLSCTRSGKRDSALEPARSDAGVETGIRLVTVDADAEHVRLKGHGVDVGEVLRWPGVPPMFMFRDPDGNRLEIVERATN